MMRTYRWLRAVLVRHIVRRLGVYDRGIAPRYQVYDTRRCIEVGSSTQGVQLRCFETLFTLLGGPVPSFVS